jgi:glycyl-tRNA synthetase beta chain
MGGRSPGETGKRKESSMSSNNLLVELFVEELPPKALKKLGEAFADTLVASLKTQGLASDGCVTTNFASPRRLAAHVTDVAARAADKPVSQKLMPVAVGLDAEGKATPALLKKLAALGADESAVATLKRENDGKADILFLDAMIQGATLQEGLQKALDEALAKLPIPKVMTYQLADGWSNVNFVRPAHGLVALHGKDVVAIETLGLKAGNTTQGHRFEAKHPLVTLKDADSYAAQLKDEGAVIASFAERRAEIERQLAAAAAKENLKPIDDDALLDEVTALVERPNVLLGQFETEFLEVPQECLILTMKANQKYFPLLDGNGKLTNKFLIVSNIAPTDASAVIGGNERVVRPRLADAKFFFDQDRKKTLESRIEGLKKVVYHNKLGSQWDRMQRVRKIAESIAMVIDPTLVANVQKATELSKTDLLTDMVAEFPELQGVMGRYYAQNERIHDDVAYAIEDHYKPRFAGDELPRSAVGMCVALADKLETLVGMFGIGNIPTGEKDPFALRRHGLGILRMVTEGSLKIGVRQLINLAHSSFDSSQVQSLTDISNKIELFLQDRFVGLLESAGYSFNQIDAVLSVPTLQDWSDIHSRLEAVKSFQQLTESESLAAANKRVGNILKKADETVAPTVVDSLLKEPAEAALAQALSKVKPQADQAFEAGDYAGSLKSLAALKAPVDDFFDNVMVNAEDPALRANRLALLSQLHAAMNRVADLSKLAA